MPLTKSLWEESINARSEYFDDRDSWTDIWKYRHLFALADFWMIFAETPEYQAKFSGDFEAFGRSMGVTWPFDHTYTPSEFMPYMPVLTSTKYFDNSGYLITIVPEGCFYLDSINIGNHTAYLDFMDWKVIEGHIKSLSEEYEGFETISKFVEDLGPFNELVLQRLKILDWMEWVDVSMTHLPSGNKRIRTWRGCKGSIICDSKNTKILARGCYQDLLPDEDYEYINGMTSEKSGFKMGAEHLTSGMQTLLWEAYSDEIENLEELKSKLKTQAAA